MRIIAWLTALAIAVLIFVPVAFGSTAVRHLGSDSWCYASGPAGLSCWQYARGSSITLRGDLTLIDTPRSTMPPRRGAILFPGQGAHVGAYTCRAYFDTMLCAAPGLFSVRLYAGNYLLGFPAP